MKSLHEQKQVSYIRQPSSNKFQHQEHHLCQHATKANYKWTHRLIELRWICHFQNLWQWHSNLVFSTNHSNFKRTQTLSHYDFILSQL